MKEIKKIRYIFLEIIIIAVGSLMISSDLIESSKDIKDMYLYYFSYHFIGQELSIIHIIISLLPISVIIAMYVDSLSYDIDKNAKYIFTRTSKRKRWFLSELLKIFKELILVDIILFIIAFIIFYILGYRIVSFLEFIKVVSKLLILLVLTHYILIIIANLISIKASPQYGYIISNLMYIVSILNIYYLSFKNFFALKYIPFIQHIITIQNNECIRRDILYFSRYINGYSFGDAIIYDLILLIIVISIGIRTISKLEFY